MDRWLGDGGMALLSGVGASLDAYGVDGEDLGWVTGGFTPLELACNPHGTVHGAVFYAVAGAAVAAAAPTKCETMRPAMLAAPYAVRGEVTRMARQVAYAEASVRDPAGQLVSRATATFLLHRDG